MWTHNIYLYCLSALYFITKLDFKIQIKYIIWKSLFYYKKILGLHLIWWIKLFAFVREGFEIGLYSQQLNMQILIQSIGRHVKEQSSDSFNGYWWIYVCQSIAHIQTLFLEQRYIKYQQDLTFTQTPCEIYFSQQISFAPILLVSSCHKFNFKLASVFVYISFNFHLIFS